MNLLDRSALKTKRGIPYFESPEIAKIGWIRHGFLTRRGGVSSHPYQSLNLSANDGDRAEHVSLNRKLIATAFEFAPERLVLLSQMHGDQILLLKGPLATLPFFASYDAMITDSPDTYLGILTADCLPILIVDQKRNVVAAVHAGRQGTALHIVRKVLKKMRDEFGSLPEDLLIALGPSVGPCCYEIDEKVFQREWEPFATGRGKERWTLDIAGFNTSQMKKEGVEEDRVFRIGLCTGCHNDLLFSYRREGRTGRQLSFVGIIG